MERLMKWSTRRLAIERIGQGEKAIGGGARQVRLPLSRAAGGRPRTQSVPDVRQRGPTPRLSDDQLREFDSLLRQRAGHHGRPNCLWSTARVAQLIRRHFGASFHPDHVGGFLRQRLGWTPWKPRHRARERGQDAIARLEGDDVFPAR